MGAPENDPRLNPGSLSRKNTLSEDTEESSAAVVEDTVGEILPSKNYNEELSRPSPSSVRKPSFSAARCIGISNQTGLHIILPSSAARATAAGVLTNLSGCIIDMSIPTSGGTAFPGLALNNIKTSLVVAGRVNGPVHITGVTDSILVVAAGQVRIHECKNVDIYLHCGSHPIIEDCSGMRFAPLPACYVSEAEETSENQWDQVDDFKWLKSGHSPNWAILAEEERLSPEVWTGIEPGKPGASVDEILAEVGIPRS
uniref:C-CAP/cofactor C-like domain-containing protein n=1 Tax=Bionectria ochroleuca TaxID=29856 RepID=A0A8H7NIV2_BIOOC